MKTIQLFFALALLGIGLNAPAQDESTSTVAKLLEGKLIQLEDGKIVDAELTGTPEFYVLYYSASW